MLWLFCRMRQPDELAHLPAQTEAHFFVGGMLGSTLPEDLKYKILVINHSCCPAVPQITRTFFSYLTSAFYPWPMSSSCPPPPLHFFKEHFESFLIPYAYSACWLLCRIFLSPPKVPSYIQSLSFSVL